MRLNTAFFIAAVPVDREIVTVDADFADLGGRCGFINNRKRFQFAPCGSIAVCVDCANRVIMSSEIKIFDRAAGLFREYRSIVVKLDFIVGYFDCFTGGRGLVPFDGDVVLFIFFGNPAHCRRFRCNRIFRKLRPVRINGIDRINRIDGIRNFDLCICKQRIAILFQSNRIAVGEYNAFTVDCNGPVFSSAGDLECRFGKIQFRSGNQNITSGFSVVACN